MKITVQEYEQAKANGISRELLQNRINTKGWDKEKAINTPTNKNMRRLKDEL